MEWLKEHVYLGTWLALPVMIIIAIIQGWTNKPIEGQRGSWPLKKVLAYLIFLICFPLSLSPSAEVGARWFAGVISVLLFIAIQATPEKEWFE